MEELNIVFGILISIFVQGGYSDETCYNKHYREYYECDHGCCGSWNDPDYGCCVNVGQIIGGAVGGFIFLMIVVFVIVFCCCKNNKGVSGGVRTVAPTRNTNMILAPQPLQQPYGQSLPGHGYPGPPPMHQYPGTHGPPGYSMQPPPDMTPPYPGGQFPPPPQYDSSMDYPPQKY